MPVAGVRTLAGIVIALLGQCCVAQEAGSSLPHGPAHGLIHFDLPRQSLQTALDQYHALTGQSLLYDGAVAEGQTAGPVQGDLTAADALNSLLAGTDVVARYTSGDAFMLIRQTPADAAQGPESETESASRSAADDKRHYYALLQARVVAALCGDAATVPGSYRLALNIWIGAGRVIDRVVLHPTGDKRRDARIHQVLGGLVLQDMPPAAVVQPITLVILPRPPAQTGDCAAPANPAIENGAS
jgi:hypothetical protein